MALLSAGALAVVTLGLAFAGVAEPAVPQFGDEIRYYLIWVGAFVGWLWMGAALFLEDISPAKNDPVLAGGMFFVGIALICIWNGVLIHDPYQSGTVRVVGYIILGTDPLVLVGYYTLVPREVRERLCDPEGEAA